MYRGALVALGGGFAVLFFVLVFPPVLQTGDIIGAFAAGFVNPFATGYSLDVFFSYGVLAVWILHERHTMRIRYGWIALIVGVVPGVATGFALYLLMRHSQSVD